MTAETKQRSLLWLVATFVGLLLLVTCLGGGAMGAWWVLHEPPEWSRDAIAPTDWASTFGVRLPSPPTSYLGHHEGFQDDLFELIVELRPSEVEPFLRINHLSRGTEPAPSRARVALEALDSTAVVSKEASLDLVDLHGPTGAIELYRDGALLEGGGRVFLFLTANSL